MKTSATVKMLRRPLMVSLSCALLVLLLGTSAAAQDDDWGLPQGISSSDPGNDDDLGTDDEPGEESGGPSEFQILDLLVYAELVPGVDPDVGRVELDKQTGVSTGVLVTESAAQAEIVAQDVSQPVRMVTLDDGVHLQGSLELHLNDSLQATLLAPPSATANVGLLVIDDGTITLEQLLDGAQNGHAPAAVSGFVVLGELPALELSTLDGLARSVEGVLPVGSHLTMLIATLDGAGQLHLSGARAGTAGGSLEVATR